MIVGVQVIGMGLEGYRHLRYVEQTADCPWVFAVFSKVNSPDDVEYVFSFRDTDRTMFGVKVLRGTAIWDRNVRKLARNIIARKALRKSLLSDDPEVSAMWKSCRP